MTLRAEVRTAPTQLGSFGSATTVTWTGTSDFTVTGTYDGDDDATYTMTVVGGGTIGTTAGIAITWTDGRSPANQGTIDVGDTYTAATAVAVAEGLSVAMSAGTIVNADSKTIAASARWAFPDEALALTFENTASDDKVARLAGPVTEDRDDRAVSLHGHAYRTKRPVGRPASLDRISYAEDASETDTMAVLHRIREGRAPLAYFPIWDFDTVLFANFQRSLIPEIGPYPTFSRNGTATYIDSRTGVLESAASGTARYQAAQLGDGILLEESRQNYFKRSEDTSHGDWTYTGTGASSATNKFLAPDGEKTGDEVNLPANADSIYQDVDTAVNGDEWILSGWFGTKEESHDVTLEIGDVGAVSVGTTTITLTDQFVRHNFVHSLSGAVSGAVRGKIKAGGASEVGKIMVWGLQIEKGTGGADPSVSSYIPTTSAAVTRNADLLKFEDPADGRPWLNAEQGSWMVWVGWEPDNRGRIFSLGDSTDWRVTVISGNVIRWQYGTGSTVDTDYLQYDLDSLTGGVPADGTMICLAGTWDHSTTTTALYVNGTSVDSTSSASGLQSPLPSLDVHLYETDKCPHRPLQAFRIDRVARSAAEIQDHYDRLNDAAERPIWRRHQGRRYEIAGESLSPGEGLARDKFFGSVFLAETAPHAGQRIGAEV